VAADTHRFPFRAASLAGVQSSIKEGTIRERVTRPRELTFRAPHPRMKSRMASLLPSASAVRRPSLPLLALATLLLAVPAAHAHGKKEPAPPKEDAKAVPV